MARERTGVECELIVMVNLLTDGLAHDANKTGSLVKTHHVLKGTCEFADQ
jgi:hypothetical protein